VNREFKIGGHVTFIDSHFVEHDALITQVWGKEDVVNHYYPACNVVWVSGDESKTDPYGRQLERATSIVHISMNPAKAMCWKWPDE
jgi:hypothetical protein